MFRSGVGVYNSNVNSLLVLLEGCKREDRYSQKMLYKDLYGFAMGIALRYSAHKEEALEILNDGFLKVFTGGIQKFEIPPLEPELSFKSWFKRILINTAIDYYRKNKKHYYHQTLEDHQSLNTGQYHTPPTVHDKLSFEEIMQVVKRLSPVYYTVFCLYAIDGYTHQEIADKLEITVGTSKSNLAKARMRLKEMIKKEHQEEYARYIG